MHTATRLLIACPAAGVPASWSFFSQPPPHASDEVPLVDPACSDPSTGVQASLAAWLALGPIELMRACAPLAKQWQVEIGLFTRADGAAAALADEFVEREKGRNRRLLEELEAVREEERCGWVGVQAEVEAWVEPLVDAERIRWSDAATAIEERHRVGERQLRKVLRRMRHSCGVWGLELGEDEGLFWKLDPTEDGARRRRRLRPNLAFDSHEEASVEMRKDMQVISCPVHRGRAHRAGLSPTAPPTACVCMCSAAVCLPHPAPVFACAPLQSASLYELTSTVGGNDRREGAPSEQGGESPSVPAGASRGSRRKRGSLTARLQHLVAPPPRLAETALMKLAAARLSASGADGQEGDQGGSLLFAGRCCLVRRLKVIGGILALTSSALHFLPSSEQLMDGAKERRWPLGKLTEVLVRRYLLEARALELFLGGGGGGLASVLLSFDSVVERQDAQRAILARQLPALLPGHSTKVEDPGERPQSPDPTPWTRAWQLGALSNFDYLMRLNSLAGRTYSDLTQYPVMPWVLSDYASPAIDLGDPRHYRDLSLPIGALNPANRPKLDATFSSLREMHDEIGDLQAAPPPFHYGSHYSSMGVVLYFLLRLEPFTTQALVLQDGHFDHADRLFHSVEEAWNHLIELNNTSDVKELIPEMYYQPALLANANDFNLGIRQVGVRRKPTAGQDVAL